MSKALLDKAYALILQQEYSAAREILYGLQDRSSTARRWLENLRQELGDDPPAPSAPEVSASATEPAPPSVVPTERTPEPSPAPVLTNAPSYLPYDDDDATIAALSASVPAPAVPVVGMVATDVRWEYREIVLKNWQQHMSNIEYALSQGGDKITIEDAYTRLLNESGAEGWEVISEEVLPQQYVRLLMKRGVRA